MRTYVRLTSGVKRTGGQKSLDYTRGFPTSRGKSNFRVTSLKFGSARNGAASIRIKVVPANYEAKLRFQERLRKNEPAAWAKLRLLKEEYAQILRSGKGTLVIPADVPVIMGQSTWLTIGGKFVVLAMRSSTVAARPNLYHMIGGVPFSPKPRRASNKLLRQNVLEELRDEVGLKPNRITLGKPLGVHLTLEREGVGLNVIQPAALDANTAAFIAKHFRTIGKSGGDNTYTLRRNVREGWEATHFVIIPTTREDLRSFYTKNKTKLTPVLASTIQRFINGS